MRLKLGTAGPSFTFSLKQNANCSTNNHRKPALIELLFWWYYYKNTSLTCNFSKITPKNLNDIKDLEHSKIQMHVPVSQRNAVSVNRSWMSSNVNGFTEATLVVLVFWIIWIMV